GDLPGDALQIVARPVHEREAGFREFTQRLRITDYGLQRSARILLVHGAEGFQGDVIESAETVARRRIAFRRESVPRQLLAERVERGDERPRRGGIADVLQQVTLGAHRLVRFRQDAGGAVPDRLVHDGAREWISGYAGEGIGSAALQREAEFAQRLVGPA